MNPDDEQEEYSDEEEFRDNYLDEQREQWEEASGMNYPIAKKSESLFSLFKDVWRTTNSTKVANLDKAELGDLGVSVRDAQEISQLATILHHKKFGEYFTGIGEITLATSMSKKGWFVELFVTSKKSALKGNISNLGVNKPKEKWRIFGRNQNKEVEP